MQINLTGTSRRGDAGIEGVRQSEARRVVRHFDQVTSARVILTVEKQSNKAEATLHVSGADLFAVASHHDMYAAIDLLADRIDDR